MQGDGCSPWSTLLQRCLCCIEPCAAAGPGGCWDTAGISSPLQVFQKELGKRAGCVRALTRLVRDPARGDSPWLQRQLEELSTRWDLVCRLSLGRQARLEAALRQVMASGFGGKGLQVVVWCPGLHGVMLQGAV